MCTSAIEEDHKGVCIYNCGEKRKEKRQKQKCNPEESVEWMVMGFHAGENVFWTII